MESQGAPRLAHPGRLTPGIAQSVVQKSCAVQQAASSGGWPLLQAQASQGAAE